MADALGAFEQCAARLLEQGYTVVPIIPGSKKPGFFCNGRWVGLIAWTTRFTGRRSLHDERERWGRAGAGIGVLGGPPSQDMVGVDIDTEDPDILAALLAVLPPTPIKKVGAKGETCFYHGPGIASQSWSIAGKRAVEIIGPGRQTVLPPTVHPDTHAPYRWLTLDTLEHVSPRELPLLPADIVERITTALAPFGGEASLQRRFNGGGNSDGEDTTPHRQLNEAALATLSDWVPALGLYKARRTTHGYEAVPIWRPSSTGRPGPQRSRNLKIVPAGIRDFGAGVGYTPLDLVMAALGCDLDAAFGFLSQRLGWGATNIAIELPDASGAPAAEAEPATQEPEAEPAAQEPKPGQDRLEPYTHVPGAVGDIIDWITSTARRPNRVLALGTAITVVGTLIGRRVAGPTRSATHLYIVSVAPATAGKDHPRRCILPLMESALAGAHVHLGDITSQQGFNRTLKANPLTVVVLDEIAGFLGRITDPRSSHWERRLAEKLREQWACSFGAIGTMTSAEQSDIHIQCPAMSIYGTSTSTEFWAVMQGSQVENGLFSRFLALESNAQVPDQDPHDDPQYVPKPLAAWLAALHCWGGSRLAMAQLSDPGVHFRPEVLPWTSREAKDCYQQLVRWAEREVEDDSRKQAYLGRVAETAVRLATIRAAGRTGPGARVDPTDMTWGADVASIAFTSMMQRSIDSLPLNARGEFVEKLLQIIERRGTITRRELQQRIKGSYRTQEVADMLKSGIEAGRIVATPNGYAARK
jgi:hypothetical protein